MLFATGDQQLWIIMSKKSAIGGYYANELRTVSQSSLNNLEHMVQMYRRNGNKEDPWISLIDHTQAIPTGNILYGEANYGGAHASVLSAHNGADVFIRSNENKVPNGSLTVKKDKKDLKFKHELLNKGTPTLIYRSSRDGESNIDFHRCCNGRPMTTKINSNQSI